MVVRGVPRGLAKDAWWLDDEDPPRGIRAGLILPFALLAADLLFWDVRPGAGLALWLVIAGAAMAMTVAYQLNARRFAWAAAVLFVATLPLFEVVQFGTVMVALFGMCAAGFILVAPDWDGASLIRAMCRLPGAGIVQTIRDVFAMRVAAPSKGRVQSALFDWGLPVAAGGLFIILFAAANPFVDQWLLALGRLDPQNLPAVERVIFWALLAIALWPLLRLSTMWPQLSRPRHGRLPHMQSGFFNARAVQRALVVFNLIFLVQTTLDAGYLWGGVTLPEGMTYAEYAHRGAYPLLVTALLAGLFALLAQPYLGQSTWVRWLLYIWVGQNVLLVISSILRLDLYVDVYGLTRLRVAAFVWMLLVAAGLLLIIMQMVERHSRMWVLARAFGLGLLAIYGCNLWNIDGLIARHNIAKGHADYYLCGLSEGAVPATRAYEIATGQTICDSWRPYLSTRDDWREWGYRNTRLHNSVAALEDTQ